MGSEQRELGMEGQNKEKTAESRPEQNFADKPMGKKKEDASKMTSYHPALVRKESSYGFEPDRKVSPKHQGKFEQMMTEEAIDIEGPSTGTGWSYFGRSMER